MYIYIYIYIYIVALGTLTRCSCAHVLLDVHDAHVLLYGYHGYQIVEDVRQ